MDVKRERAGLLSWESVVNTSHGENRDNDGLLGLAQGQRRARCHPPSRALAIYHEVLTIKPARPSTSRRSHLIPTRNHLPHALERDEGSPPLHLGPVRITVNTLPHAPTPLQLGELV